MADDRYDGLLMTIAQQQQQQNNGIDGILDVFFSFLYRKTDFFTHPELAKKSVDACMERYVTKAQETQRAREKAAEEAARKKAVEASAKAKARHEQQDIPQGPFSSRVEVLDDDDDENNQKQMQSTNIDPKNAVDRINTRKSDYDSQTSDNKATEVKYEDNSADTFEAKATKRRAEIERQQRELEEIQRNDNIEEADKPKGLKPTPANGFEYAHYSFSQSLQEAEVRIPLPVKNVKGKQVSVEIKQKHLTVGLKGKPPLVDGELFAPVKVEECMWTVEDGCIVVITLYKANTMEWWKTIIQGDPEIDLQKVMPENSKLDDLDSDTRQTVEKMMYDQRQKALGRPTSEEAQKQAMLKKFMDAHPEMDFSQAKFC